MDSMGIFELTEAQAKDVSDLVHEFSWANNKFYLSRNSDYYNMTNAQDKMSQMREHLGKKFINCNDEIQAAVIADKMLKISGDVAYTHLQNYSKNQPNEYLNAKECLNEDVARFLSLMEDGTVMPMESELSRHGPTIHGKEETQNNFKIIKMFLESLPPEARETIVITAGYGGFYIGPSAKHLLDTDYYVLNYSGNKNDDNTKKGRKLTHFLNISDFETLELLGEDLTILEDDICSGKSIEILRQLLEREGFSVRVGATEYGQNKITLPSGKYDYLSPLTFSSRTSPIGKSQTSIEKRFNNVSSNSDDYENMRNATCEFHTKDGSMVRTPISFESRFTKEHTKEFFKNMMSKITENNFGQGD